MSTNWPWIYWWTRLSWPRITSVHHSKMAPVPDPRKLTSQDTEGTGDPAAWIMASEYLWVPNLSTLIFLSRGSKQRCSKNQRFHCSCPLFNIPDEAVPAIPVRHHLPSIGRHLVQAPGSRGRRPAWRLCPVAGKKERKAWVHLIPEHFLWDKLQKGHGTCSSPLWAIFSAD